MNRAFVCLAAVIAAYAALGAIVAFSRLVVRNPKPAPAAPAEAASARAPDDAAQEEQAQLPLAA